MTFDGDSLVHFHLILLRLSVFMAHQHELGDLAFLIANTRPLLKCYLQLQPEGVIRVQRIVLVLEILRKMTKINAVAAQSLLMLIYALLYDHFLIGRLMLRPDDLMSDQTIRQG